MMTYLDCEEIQNPKVIYFYSAKVEIPSKYLQGEFRRSGTLVVWKNLDRLNPKKSTTVISHLNNEMCRIFRHFLDDNDDYGTRRNIKVQVVDPEGKLGEPLILKANDPLYFLLQITSNHTDKATNVIDDEAFISVKDRKSI